MKKLFVTVSIALTAGLAWCARIDRGQAQRAVSNWMRQNGIAKSLFTGSSIAEIAAYDAEANIWIAHLSPHGYVALAGSDLRKPIIAFSQNDLERPGISRTAAQRGEDDGGYGESPLIARLDASAAATFAAEAAGGERHEEWTVLLSNMMLRSAVPATQLQSHIIVEPFMNGTQWNQCQPYNDFSPVHDPSETGAYRGRTSCGCVATALSQVLAYWKWPHRMEGSRTHAHEFNGMEAAFPIRFDGNAPFDWTALAKEYDYYKSGYDLRGKVAESVRFPVARLVLFADSLAQMAFGSDGSAADNNVACASVSEWYYATEYNWVDYMDYPTLAARMKADLLARRPVIVGIPGHAIVAHGWAEDGNDHYAYYNYGWGGSGDGWYLTSGGVYAENLKTCNTGFRPKRMVQVDPLPAVVENEATLAWHLPPCYDGEVTGFEISKIEVGDSVAADFTDDFTSINGQLANPDNGSVATVSGIGNDTSLLSFDPRYENVYTYHNAFHLTSRSELSFRLRSDYALNSRLDVQARINGGDWATIASPSIAADSYGDWETVRLYLGGNGGDDVQLRFMLVRTGNSYYPKPPRMVCIDDVRVSEILGETKTMQTVSASARSLTVQNLASGKGYSFAVKPLFANGGGIVSQPVQTQVAGIVRTALPGERSFRLADASYSSSDDLWSVANSTVSGTKITTGNWEGSVAYVVSGELTAESAVSFNWTAKGYYADNVAYDVLEVKFIDSGCVEHMLLCHTNAAMQSSGIPVSCPLGAYAGQSGKVVASFRHEGPQYTAVGYGMEFHNPVVSNVMVADLPTEIAWETRTVARAAEPVILSVAGSEGYPQVAEGFYRENALGGNVIWVKCSGSVTELKARPSHLALVDDGDVDVHALGGGGFAVVVRADPAKVPARSRMILTLEARNANGTAVYKDLSLRFDPAASGETYAAQPTAVDVETTIFGGVRTVSVPMEWFEETGLAQAGADYALLAAADSDGDGFSNLAEYVCGTDPMNVGDRLMCFIQMVNGSPVVTHSATNVAPGFRATVKGTIGLAQPNWQPQAAAHRFFKVVIEPVSD